MTDEAIARAISAALDRVAEAIAVDAAVSALGHLDNPVSPEAAASWLKSFRREMSGR